MTASADAQPDMTAIGPDGLSVCWCSAFALVNGRYQHHPSDRNFDPTGSEVAP